MCKWLVLVPVFLLGASLWAAPQDAPQPSLGDLARQQKAKEKQAPKKVFNNDNLPANDGSVTTGATGATVVAPPSPSSAAPAGSAGAAAAKPAAGGAAAANRKVDPEKVKEAQVKLDRLKNDMNNLEKNYKSLEEKVANSTDDFQRRIYQEGLDTRQSETAALQQRLDAAQKELEDAQKGELTTAAPAPAPAPQQQAQEGEQQPPAPESPQ